MKISEIIRKLRFDTRRTQTKMGVSQMTISGIESGKVSPTVSTLEKIAQATGMELEINFKSLA